MKEECSLCLEYEEALEELQSELDGANTIVTVLLILLIVITISALVSKFMF